jgi:hypothetical protein
MAAACGHSRTAGETVERLIVMPLGTREEKGVERLSQAAGLSVRIEYDKIFVNDVAFNRVAQSSGLESDCKITGLKIDNSQPSKVWMYLKCISVSNVQGAFSALLGPDAPNPIRHDPALPYELERRVATLA